MLLQIGALTGFRWALYYELEGQGDPSVSTLASDLAYIGAINSVQELQVTSDRGSSLRGSRDIDGGP